jgi:hypothetical protein
MFAPCSLPLNALAVADTFRYGTKALIRIMNIGAIALEFDQGSDLRSIDVLDYRGKDATPQVVMTNLEEVKALQVRRVHFANFIAACLLGRVAARKHRSLSGVRYSGLDQICAFIVHGQAIQLPPSETHHFLVLARQQIATVQSGQKSNDVFAPTDLQDAIQFIERLHQRASQFSSLDIEASIVMSYQAAILHNQQQAAACFALSFSVIESLVHEVILAHGLVSGVPASAFAKSVQAGHQLSLAQFGKANFERRLKLLHSVGLIKNYLYQRLDDARKKRNGLMHKGERITPMDSGDCLTMIRDILGLLIEQPFELNMPWSYRI